MPGGGVDAAFRFLVLRQRDLAVAQEELPQRVFGRVGRGEDDLAVLPVNVPLQLVLPQGQLSRALDHGDKAEHVRQLDAREIALEDGWFRHEDRDNYSERPGGERGTGK